MHKIVNIFPTPIYVAKREIDATTFELEDIKSIIEKASVPTGYIISSRKDTHIFDTKLNSLKEFCELHINIYVNEIISPKNTELDFYITQSWLNIVHPGESHPIHCHTNSIISGIFYVSTVEGDAIQLYDINTSVKDRTKIESGKTNLWNVSQQNLDIGNNVLLLFPSWIGHGVKQNASTTTDRISISFNVFVKGTIGEYHTLDNLNLQ